MNIKLQEVFDKLVVHYTVLDNRIQFSVLLSALCIASAVLFLFILPDQKKKKLKFIWLIGAIVSFYFLYLVQRYNTASALVGIGIGILTSVLIFPEFKEQISFIAEYYGIRSGTFNKSIKNEISKNAEEKIEELTPQKRQPPDEK